MSFRQISDFIPPADIAKDRFAVLRWIRNTYKTAEMNGDDTTGYLVDWVSVMTPIERHVWSSIRSRGLPMRPQYPVGPYFADFADPDQKIVIECDGAQFHQDKARDARRDEWMHKAGWRVIRIPGFECVKPEIDWQEVIDLEQADHHEKARQIVEDWITETADGLMYAISTRIYGRAARRGMDEAMDSAIEAHTASGTQNA